MRVKIRADLRARLAKLAWFKLHPSWKDDEWELEDDIWKKMQEFLPGETDPNVLLEMILDKADKKKPN